MATRMRSPGVLLAVCLLLGTSLACTADQLVGALAVNDGGVNDDDGGIDDDDGGNNDDNGDGGPRDGGGQGQDGGDEARAFPRSN